MARRQVLNTYCRHRQRVVSVDGPDVFTNDAGKTGNPFSSFSSSGSSGISRLDSLGDSINAPKTRLNKLYTKKESAKENAFQTPDWTCTKKGYRARKPEGLIDISNMDLSKSTTSSGGIFKSPEKNRSCRILRNKTRRASEVKPYTTAKKSQRKRTCAKTTGKKVKSSREPIGVAKRNLNFVKKQQQQCDSVNSSCHGPSKRISFSEFDKYSLIVSDSAPSPGEEGNDKDEVPPTPEIEFKSSKQKKKANTLTSTPQHTRTDPKSNLYKNLLHNSEISHIDSIRESPEPIGCRTRAHFSKCNTGDGVSHLDLTDEPSIKWSFQLEIQDCSEADGNPDMSVEACSIAMDKLVLTQDLPNHSKSGILGISSGVDACRTPFRTFSVSARYPTRSKGHLNIPHITSDLGSHSELSNISSMHSACSESNKSQAKTVEEMCEYSLHECYIKLEKLRCKNIMPCSSSATRLTPSSFGSLQETSGVFYRVEPESQHVALQVPSSVMAHRTSQNISVSSFDGSKSLFSSSAHSQFTEHSSERTSPSNSSNRSTHVKPSTVNSVCSVRTGSDLFEEGSIEEEISEENGSSGSSVQECSEESKDNSGDPDMAETTQEYTSEEEKLQVCDNQDVVVVSDESEMSSQIVDPSEYGDGLDKSTYDSAEVSRYMLAEDTVGHKTNTSQANVTEISEGKTGSFHSCESKHAESMERSHTSSEADMSMDNSITRRRKPKNKLIQNVQSELESSCVSVKDILTPVRMKRSGRIVTAREKILLQCSQSDVCSFSECITPAMMKKCVKIGEGVYGEVFKTIRNKQHVALKVIPIEGDFPVNDEPQKHFDEMIPEIVITKELSQLREGEDNTTENFVQVKGIYLVQGSYPEKLLRQWDDFHATKVSENDRPDIFGDDQQFIVFEFEDAGRDLEGVKLDNLMQARSILFQVTCSLAIAEVALQFEHRDLHWGNILVKETEEETLWYTLDGQEVGVDMCGVKVSIIDFTLSRLSKDGCSVFTDLSTDPTLFEGQGDYQFDVYRLMKDENLNNWKTHHPFTNVLWIHYLADKLLNGKSYSNAKSREHKSLARQYRTFLREALDYRSALHLLRHCPFFSE